MDPPIINEASFSAANPSSYSLAELWPFSISGTGAVSCDLAAGLGLKMGSFSSLRGDVSFNESGVTEQCGSLRKRKDACSGDEASHLATTSNANVLNDSPGKRTKALIATEEIDDSKAEGDTSSGTGNKATEQKVKPEPPKDYIHVRARRGQAKDSHSLAERARREKISERMRILQDLVPGCNKVIGKALVLDEIINYIQSLQRQVEFLSMKLEAVNSKMSPAIEGFHPKEFAAPSYSTGMVFGSQATRQYEQGAHSEWLHMQNDSPGKRTKALIATEEIDDSKAEGDTSSGTGNKATEQKVKPEPPKDYIHVRARRGQAKDSHSLAERARREKISERMRILQDLVPGCNKVIGKALVLDEIINYIQSLQRQVEFLSMKLEAVNSKMSPAIEGFHPKEFAAPSYSTGMVFGSQATRQYEQGAHSEWLHMQVGGSFERAT